jgi:membrane fusion protein, multidrug efflux system
MNPRLRLAILLGAAVALALASGACKPHGGPPQRPPMSVKLAPAVSLDAPVVLHAFGTTRERFSVDVVPQVSGKLIQTFMKDGSVVTNGQPLFLIDPSDYEIKVQQGEAAVAASRANLKLIQMTVDRNEPLLAKELISQENFDTLKTQMKAAAAQVQADEAALQQAQLNLSRCTVASAIDGVCSKRFVDDGNLVAAGMTKLTNVRSYDPLNVEFSVSEQYLGVIRAALAKGAVSIEVLPRGDTNAYPGTLEFVDNAVDARTGTILLRGLVPNPDLKLWSMQFVEVSVMADVVPGAVMVPEGAVQMGKQGMYLFVAKPDNTADLRPVQVGIRYDSQIQIVSGVAPGENVVALGQLMLYPGAQVVDLSKMPPPGAPAGGPPAAAGHGAP